MRHEASFTIVKLLKMLNGKVVSYGTITSNGVATAKDAKPPNKSPLKTRASYIINPEGRVNKCHTKPQPSKFFQLINSQNERRRVNLASMLTMAMKKKSQIDSVACANPGVPSCSPADKPMMA